MLKHIRSAARRVHKRSRVTGNFIEDGFYVFILPACLFGFAMLFLFGLVQYLFA
jgi:hypothetical protein